MQTDYVVDNHLPRSLGWQLFSLSARAVSADYCGMESMRTDNTRSRSRQSFREMLTAVGVLNSIVGDNHRHYTQSFGRRESVGDCPH